MSDIVIRTDRLTHYYGRTCAVDQVSLSVPRGAVFALLGRNGSGKTTLIRMLLGLLEPTRGSSHVLGEDSRRLAPATRARIGYVAEGHPLIGWMRVGELESFQRRSYPQWNGRIFKAIVDHFGLDAKAKASQLSRGQRAGLSLALSMATDPDVVIMDDPSLGLDPVARRSLLEAIILLTRDAGRTILFSSHLLEDVERVADHVAILDHSVLRVSAPMETFRNRVKRLTLRFAHAPPPSELPRIPGLLRSRRDDADELTLILANAGPDTDEIVRSLGATAVEEAPVSFEDAVIGYLAERRTHVSLLHDIRAAAATSNAEQEVGS